jgi:hypothetical protein
MSSTTLSSSGPSQLVTRSHIAEALAAHGRYVERLDRWYEWLGDETDASNAQKLMLYKLIESTIARREPGGEWANQDEDLIPAAADLRDMLDQAKYTRFRSQLEKLRSPVERAGLELVTLLQSTEFLTELDLLPWDEQLVYVSRLADQLASSNVGFLYLRQAVGAGPTTPLPVFHPDRLFRKPGDFLETHNAIMGRAASVFAEVFLKVAPAILVNADYNAFAFATLDLVNKYFPEDVLDALTFEDKIDDVRIFMQQNPTYLERYGKPAAAAIGTIMELVGVYFALDALRKDPSIRNSFGLLRAVASLTSTLATTQAILKLPQGFAVHNRIAGINVIVAVYDLAIAAIDTHASWKTNDLSVAAGHALQGVGLAGAAAISTWAAMSAAGTVAPSAALNPVAGALLTLGALVVTFGGTFLIMYTQDPPVERWFENNYFGSNWDSVDADVSPLEIMFRWKRPDGTPDIPRQVSEYLSMFFPMKVTATENDNGSVNVDVFPSLGYHESHVLVKRVKDDGMFSDPQHTLLPLYMKPANQTDDGVTLVRPSDPTEDQRLTNWFRRFSPLEMSGELDPNFDASGSVIEVDLTIPDKFQAALSGIVMTSPGVMDEFPFVLRSRVRVE